MKVQKLKTIIKLGCNKEKAVLASPAFAYPKVLVMRYKGEVIFTERNPLSESKELAHRVRQYSPLNFSFMIERPRERKHGYIRLGKETYYVGGLSNETYITVESFSSEANSHYEKVERIRDQLISLGLPVIDGECEITITKKC